MQLDAHELYDLNELTMSCVNSITCMAYFIDHAKDQDFKQLLIKHFPYHVRDYNMKVEFISKHEGASKELPRLQIQGNLPNYTQAINQQMKVMQPRTSIQDMNDNEMMVSYLLTLKRAGREYAWTAMETANPELRGFFETAFLMSCSHAYDMWQLMVKKGLYPLQPASQEYVAQIGNMYRVVPENQGIDQILSQKNTLGNSANMYQS